MYLIFTVMMSILFLSVLVSQHVNLDALLIAERWYDFFKTFVPQLKQEARPYLRDTGVIVWKWPCVLPLVTCLKCYGNITLLAISV